MGTVHNSYQAICTIKIETHPRVIRFTKMVNISIRGRIYNVSTENILSLVVANINFHRSQCLSLILILHHISRAYKYKKESIIFIIYFQCQT